MRNLNVILKAYSTFNHYLLSHPLEASTHLSCFGGGAEAKVVLAGGSVSIFNLQLGFGVSTSAGIVDDSVEVKVLGLGVSVGRKNEICVFDNCFGVDLGAFW